MTEQRNYDRTDYVTEKRPKIEQIEHDRAEELSQNRGTITEKGPMTEQIENDMPEQRNYDRTDRT